MHVSIWNKSKLYLQHEFFYSISDSLLHCRFIRHFSFITRSCRPPLFISHSIDLVFQSHPSHFESGVAKHLLMPHHSYLGLASERIYVTAKPIFGTSSVQQIIQTMVCTPLPARQTCIYITRNKQQIMRLER